MWGAVMYEKLARGYATAYINSLQDYGRLVDWFEDSRMTKALDAFERSSFSKKPGRVLKRLTPHLHPPVRQPKICSWTRRFKAISTRPRQVLRKIGYFVCR